jgi:membrane protein YqaA with SNARE-associated domain
MAERSASRRLLHWLYHLGGIGLIPLGMLDNSVVPVTGSMDVITVLLCAQGKSWWPYYVLMAIVGSLLGGYTTFRLARGEGKGRLGKVISRKRMVKVKEIFEKYGFGAIVVPAILPPPFPMVPFLIAAGASEYPRHKFITALAIGRAIRYTILGLLGFLYGRWIITVMREHVWALAALGGFLVVLSATIAYFRLRHDDSVHALHRGVARS